MHFNIGSRCSNKKYWKLMFDLIISFHVVPKSTVKHTHSAQMEIVIICSWNSLNPHSVHGNGQTCDPPGLEVACSCKETQTRVSSLGRCSLHLLNCALSSRVFFCMWLLLPSVLQTSLYMHRYLGEERARIYPGILYCR